MADDGGMAAVDPLTSVTLCAVLKDALDQYSVLAGVAQPPKQNRETDSMMESIVGEEIEQEIQGQRQLEREYDALIAEREEMQMTGATDFALRENEAKVREVAKALKASTQVLVKNLRQNPGAVENMIKLQSERHHVQGILKELHEELGRSDTFESLLESVQDENEKRATFMQAVSDAENSRLLAAQLHHDLAALSINTEQQVRELDEEIAQLKDQLQETKARVALEGKYIKKDMAVTVSVTSKRLDREVGAVKARIEALRTQIAQEELCHSEIAAFAKRNEEKLQAKSDEWQVKFENECMTKRQAELDQLKATRAKDLQTLKELASKYKEYETICLADRQRRKNEELEAQRAVLQLVAAIKIQAWWRGVSYRAGKKGGKGKGKKGKKGSKKKKKK